MAYLVFIKLVPTHVTENHFQLKSLTSKIQMASSGSGFINQA